jgi:polyisoprenoid-binding protein YceI
MQITTRLGLLIGGAALVAAFSGCADPAKDVPKAQTAAPAAAASAPAAAASAAPAGLMKIDGAASSIKFVGANLTTEHPGGFKTFSGTIVLEGSDVTKALVAIEIDMKSVYSDDEKLTGHLKSPDFFDVESHPSAKFTTTKIEAGEGGAHTVHGQLQLRGITKAISFPATITAADGKATASAKFAINRKDYKIEYPGKPDNLIKDDVVIELNLVASK